MSYTIEPYPLNNFIDDAKLKLPRFQRKATWTDKQNFELCISVFQDYPVGVVIVNREKDISWLLDGRQRRNALIAMRKNPVAVCEWAVKYIKIKAKDDECDITKKFWGEVDKYLQTEEKDDSEKDSVDEYDFGTGETALTGDIDSEAEEDDENLLDGEVRSFSSVKQKEGLTILLDLINMVHKVGKEKSKWEKAYDFNEYFSHLQYAPKKQNYEVDPISLRDFLLDYYKAFPSDITEATFFSYFEEKCAFKDGKEDEFKKTVNQNWNYLLKSVEVIRNTEKVFEEARIGIIYLNNATPLDAQNIFSRINKGGTLLKAEELLSAKPYWNEAVDVVDESTKSTVKEMYRKMGVGGDESDVVVRWDLAATLLSRLDPNHLIFDGYGKIRGDGEIPMDEIILGFKALSSYYQGGMSANCVNSFEKSGNSFNWNSDIDDFVDKVNKVCEILMTDEYFKTFQSWKKPMAKLMGSAITLEFITIMLKDWINKKCPTVDGSDYKSFKRDARILFDRLVYEYSTRIWRGSGDSKMALDIASWQKRLVLVDEKEWTNFVEGALDGEFNGQMVNQKLLTPILYHYYSLNGLTPLNEVNVTFDVEHIIPQEKFRDNQTVDIRKKDALTNLALFPKKENIKKGSKSLAEIKTDAWLKKHIITYSGIKEKDFEKYSDITNIPDMRKKRGKLFLDTFGKTRKSQLSN